MDYGIGGMRGPGSRPVWLVDEPGLDTWLSTLPETRAIWVRSAGFRGEAQQLLCMPGDDGAVGGAALGLGPRPASADLSPWALAALPQKLPEGYWHLATPLTAEAATRALFGWAMGRYRFDRYRQATGKARGEVVLEAPAGADVAHARRAAAAETLARDLINTPAGDMGPEELAAAAVTMAQRYDARCEQVVGDALTAAGLHMIHAVGRAGPQPPRLVDIHWGDAAHPRVTLVGKGVCFDTGGLDIKNPQGMLLMKKDMGGAACAIGLAQMVMDARLPVRLRVLLPAVENSVDSRAYRPGDVLATRKGLTVEVGNTDAEGRLVLADALALADEDRPDLLLDFATLTGAARVALGPDLPALFSNRDELAQSIEAAAREEGDPLWRLPLWGAYDEDLASKVADLSNISGNSFAGAIIGGLFLQRFVSRDTRWAHLDLYGWSPRERPGRPVGGQAQSIRALYRTLQGLYPGQPG